MSKIRRKWVLLDPTCMSTQNKQQHTEQSHAATGGMKAASKSESDDALK